MKQQDMLKLAIKLIKTKAKEQPNKSFTNSAGEKATINDVVKSLERMEQWLYPDLQADDVTLVVHCKNCKHYKKYKKKGEIKTSKFYSCDRDMNKRLPDFFCKDGERNETDH